MEVTLSFIIKGVKEPFFNTLRVSRVDTPGSYKEIVLDRRRTEWETLPSGTDDAPIIRMEWSGVYVWDGENELIPDEEDLVVLNGLKFVELEVEDDAPFGYNPEVLEITAYLGPNWTSATEVNILRTLDDYEVCLETVKDGCCEDSEVLNSFRCVQFHNMNEQVARSWALWFINKDRQKLLPEIEENKTVCIRRYQFQVDDASYTINYHLVDVEDVLEELKLRKEEANG